MRCTLLSMSVLHILLLLDMYSFLDAIGEEGGGDRQREKEKERERERERERGRRDQPLMVMPRVRVDVLCIVTSNVPDVGTMASLTLNMTSISTTSLASCTSFTACCSVTPSVLTPLMARI